MEFPQDDNKNRILHDMHLLQDLVETDQIELKNCIKGDIYDSYRKEMDLEKKKLKEIADSLKIFFNF